MFFLVTLNKAIEDINFKLYIFPPRNNVQLCDMLINSNFNIV